MTPSLWRTVPGVGLYFTVFHGLAGDRQLAAGEGLALGGVTRVLAGTLLIPVTVVKTRWEARDSRYRGVLRALVTIQQGEGVRGLASGLLPTLLRDVPYSALYLGAYSQLKQLLPPRSSALPPAGFAVGSACMPTSFDIHRSRSDGSRWGRRPRRARSSFSLLRKCASRSYSRSHSRRGAPTTMLRRNTRPQRLAPSHTAIDMHALLVRARKQPSLPTVSFHTHPM